MYALEVQISFHAQQFQLMVHETVNPFVIFCPAVKVFRGYHLTIYGGSYTGLSSIIVLIVPLALNSPTYPITWTFTM